MAESKGIAGIPKEAGVTLQAYSTLLEETGGRVVFATSTALSELRTGNTG